MSNNKTRTDTRNTPAPAEVQTTATQSRTPAPSRWHGTATHIGGPTHARDAPPRKRRWRMVGLSWFNKSR
jgi:hypothetical protein